MVITISKDCNFNALKIWLVQPAKWLCLKNNTSPTEFVYSEIKYLEHKIPQIDLYFSFRAPSETSTSVINYRCAWECVVYDRLHKSTFSRILDTKFWKWMEIIKVNWIEANVATYQTQYTSDMPGTDHVSLVLKGTLTPSYGVTVNPWLTWGTHREEVPP